jgi:hypothetical protein
MRVFLDEAVCNVSAHAVGDALAAGAAQARAQGRMIVDVVVDGRAWTQDELTGAAASNTALEVRLVTADPADLVCQTLADAAIALTDADRLQQSAAELIQTDQLVQAMPKLNEAFSIWLAVQQAVTMGTEVAGLSLGEMEQVVGRLNDQLRTVRDALQQQDTAALSDALLYDFPHVVSEWQDMLQGLQKQVRGQQI